MLQRITPLSRDLWTSVMEGVPIETADTLVHLVMESFFQGCSITGPDRGKARDIMQEPYASVLLRAIRRRWKSQPGFQSACQAWEVVWNPYRGMIWECKRTMLSYALCISDKHRPAFLAADTLDQFLNQYERSRSETATRTGRPTVSGDVNKFFATVMQFDHLASLSMHYDFIRYANDSGLTERSARCVLSEPGMLVRFLRFYGRVSHSDWFFTDAALRGRILAICGNAPFHGFAISQTLAAAAAAACAQEKADLKEEEKKKRRGVAPEALSMEELQALQIAKHKQQQEAAAAAKLAKSAAAAAAASHKQGPVAAKFKSSRCK
jgi:hypothetical protein